MSAPSPAPSPRTRHGFAREARRAFATVILAALAAATRPVEALAEDGGPDGPWADDPRPDEILG